MRQMGECAQADYQARFGADWNYQKLFGEGRRAARFESMIELGVTPTMIQPVILCGGSGTRLWPLSREHYPKQLHALNGPRTLLQDTALRSVGLAAIGEPLVVCNEGHRFMVAEQLRRIGANPKAILLEPAGRGTAPALTVAAVHSVTADDPVLLVMPPTTSCSTRRRSAARSSAARRSRARATS